MAANYNSQLEHITLLDDGLNLWKGDARDFIPKRYRANATDVFITKNEGTIIHEYGHHLTVKNIDKYENVIDKYFH